MHSSYDEAGNGSDDRFDAATAIDDDDDACIDGSDGADMFALPLFLIFIGLFIFILSSDDACASNITISIPGIVKVIMMVIEILKMIMKIIMTMITIIMVLMIMTKVMLVPAF